MISAYHIMGSIYWQQGDLDASIETNLKSITLSRQLGRDHSLAASLNNLANAYADKGEHEKAIESYEQARAICKNFFNISRPKK